MAKEKNADQNTFPEITTAQRNRLQQLFENGNKQMSLGGRDYATDMFTECVLGDPGNIIYMQSFIANLRLKFGEKKKKSIFSGLSSGGLKAAEMQKKWVNVLKSGLELLKANPWNADAFAAMGRACLELGFDEAGLAYLKQSIESNPGDSEVCRLAARILREKKKFDDALACWNRVKKVKPNDDEANRAIGDIMVEKTIHHGGYDSAESTREVRTSRRTDKDTLVPEDEDVMGNRLSFEQQIQRRLKKDPDDLDAYLDLAEYHFQGERFRDAEKAFRQAHEMASGKTDLSEKILDMQKRALYADLLGIKEEFAKQKTPRLKQEFYEKKREYEEKNLELARQRVKNNPANAQNHYELGSLYHQLGRIKEAIGEYQQAKSDTIRSGEALLALGQCFQQIKQYKLAATHYQQAIDAITGNGEEKKKALYLAAKLALGLKEYRKADDYAQALAAIDFSYKDIGDLLDKIAQYHHNG